MDPLRRGLETGWVVLLRPAHTWSSDKKISNRRERGVGHRGQIQNTAEHTRVAFVFAVSKRNEMSHILIHATRGQLAGKRSIKRAH